MVEFALVLPIFVALVFGVISFGYMLSYRQAISQAAAEGARALAVAPRTVDVGSRENRARAAINQSLNVYGISCGSGNLSRNGNVVGTCEVVPDLLCPGGPDAAPHCAKVTLTHAYRDHPLIPSFPGLGVTLPDQLSYTAYVEVTAPAAATP